MKIRTGIVLFALFLVIFIGGGLVIFGDNLFNSNHANPTTTVINLNTSTQTTTDSTISTQSSIITVTTTATQSLTTTVTTTPTQLSLTTDSQVSDILKEDSITLDIYDSTAWNNYTKPTTLPINMFGVYISPIFALSPGQQVTIAITSEIPISTSSSPNGFVVNVFNAGSDIINWDVNQHADISSEVYNVYENSRVMILTIGNIETYTSYFYLQLRNFSSFDASFMYVISDTGNTVPVVTRTIITSTHIGTVHTTVIVTTTLLSQVTITYPDYLTSTAPITIVTVTTSTYTIPIPDFTVTSSPPTTIGGTTIIHTYTETTITHTVTVTVTVTNTVTVTVPEV